MQQNGYIRVLFGKKKDYGSHAERNRSLGIKRCRYLLENDLKLIKHVKHDPDFTFYIFGKENYEQCVDMGFNCELISNNPTEWDIEKEGFRHKLEALKIGSRKFKELILLDIDTVPHIPIPKNIWDLSRKKAPIQASLRLYKKIKAPWRQLNKRTIPTAAYIYLRGEEVAQGIIDAWEEVGRPLSEEIALAKYIDNYSDGWKGLDYYWDHFEPDFFTLEKSLEYPHANIFSDEKLNLKTPCFHHIDGSEIKRILRNIKGGKTPNWIK